jgi:hypothetical protein
VTDRRAGRDTNWAPSRRGFLLAAGGTIGAGLVTACGGGDNPRPADEPIITRPDRLDGDLSVAALLVSLENLMVSVYREALGERRERLGQIPPATLALIEAAQAQHVEHAAAWNGILTSAGKPGITGVNLTVKSITSDRSLATMRDAGALLSLGQELEAVTAATYLAAIGTLQNNAVLKVAASIHPVENQHVAAMAFLLGRTPVPDGFGRTDAGRPPTDSVG